MNKKILILGEGFLGRRLREELGCISSRKKIYSYKDAERQLKKFKPRTIINCIGHVGRNVDDCEKSIDKTLIANSFVPLILAELASRYKIKLIHISSGCIFHYNYKKDKPLNEEKVPDFFELFYSRAKIYSERALGLLSKKFPILIIRIRVPLDNRPHPRNLLDKLIKYKTIIDLPNSVTYIPDFIQALRHLMAKNARGIYNVVNKGGLRYPELMCVYKRYFPRYKYRIVNFNDLNLVRTNLVLSTRKLEKSGFKVRNVHEVLEECVKEYVKY
ncbi:MAG: hypothetical protein DRP74_03525 [Candidatus Omnitrophota bacterium]|nr:MAG: hypothetical protein DRP74_03525 [Candidatus Omnitrophota bacterium]